MLPLKNDNFKKLHTLLNTNLKQKIDMIKYLGPGGELRGQVWAHFIAHWMGIKMNPNMPGNFLTISEIFSPHWFH